jgi:hypothetical protein
VLARSYAGLVARRGTRWLKVGADRFAWSVGHAHERKDGTTGEPSWVGCREVVRVRRDGAPGQLLVVFRAGDGRIVRDGLMHSGAVQSADGQAMNLNEPGAIRALLDEAIARGWEASAPGRSEIDGWLLLDAVAARRVSVADADENDRRGPGVSHRGQRDQEPASEISEAGCDLLCARRDSNP